MREAINNNPLVQIGLIAVLGLFAVIMLMSSLGGHKAAPADSGTTPTPAAAVGSADSAIPGGDVAAPATGSTDASASGSAATPAGPMVAGRGLPAPLVRAYSRGDAVVLLVAREGSIEDRMVTESVRQLRAGSNVAVFVVRADKVARYSRITEGVGVDRTPALVVILPKRLSDGVPTAQVSYGFRDAGSVVQAVHDALYDGPTISYHPR